MTVQEMIEYLEHVATVAGRDTPVELCTGMLTHSEFYTFEVCKTGIHKDTDVVYIHM